MCFWKVLLLMSLIQNTATHALDKNEKFSFLPSYKSLERENKWLRQACERVEKVKGKMSFFDMKDKTNSHKLEHLDFLEGVRFWNKEAIVIMKNTIEKFQKDKSIEKFFQGDWVHTLNKDYSGHILETELNQWKKLFNENINFHVFREFLNKNSIKDNVYAFLEKELTEDSKTYKMCQVDVGKKLSAFLLDVETQKDFEKKGGFLQYKEYDFSIYNEQLSQDCIQALHDEIQSMDEKRRNVAIEFMKQYTHEDLYGQVVQYLSHLPKMEKLGHTGMSISWTFQSLSHLYKVGWEKFSKSVLVGRGIGFPQLSFEEGMEIENEELALYHFHTVSGKKDLKRIVDFCVEKKWHKLLEKVLDNSPNLFSYQDYFQYLIMENYDRVLFDSARKHYKNEMVMDLSSYDKKKIIFMMWQALPFVDENKKETLTLEEVEVRDCFLIYKGKSMPYIGEWNKFPIIFFDVKMKTCGAFKNLLSKL